MRTGIGYDIHRIIKGRKLVLGGVEIDSKFGLDGHSDADVITHSVCDALLGAAALGDIGQHFPDNDERYKNISSLKLLAEVIKLINRDVNNVDVTVICENPKLEQYLGDMKDNIASIIGVPSHDINIKATTNEQIGEIGRGEAIAAIAIATIIPTPKYDVGDN